ncbi:hypothetical protein SNE40_015762 [Patella caerulea]|uniref:Endonuclease n=1 Tax=Patella caerulea TaxID=87958 RepID=A0AAN8PSJ0_PATCE
MLVDTGANITLLNREVLDKLTKKSSSIKLLPVNLSMVTATGELSPFHGKTHLKIKLGKRIVSQEVYITDIQNDGILGLDFLTNIGGDVILSKNCLNVKGEEIPCYFFSTEAEPKVCRLALAEDTVVPPETEIIVSGKFIDPVINMQKGIIEPLPGFTKKTGLLLAKCFVNTRGGNIPLRIINVTNQPCKIYKNTVAAQCEVAEEIVKVEQDNSVQQVYNVTKTHILPDHVTEVLDRSIPNLNDSEKEKLRNLLIKHSDLFSKDSLDIGGTNLVEHRINTGNAMPIKQPPRRIPLAKLQEAREEIEKMAKQGIISPSISPWSSPVVLVKKKDNSTRFCVDYRKLNDVTIKDSHPLPRIDDTLDALSGAKLFSTLDLKSGYHQVKLAESDKEKSAFSVYGSGLWEFNVMSFGLCNAPGSFERLMERVLKGLSWQICLVYLDDIIVYSKSFEQHLENLTKVFECLKQANLKLNPKKCHLTKEEVTYLGHIVSAQGIATDPAKIEAVKNWPVPVNVKQIRSFLGLCSYYRRFVKGFADIARPLHKLTEKARPFQWTEECHKAFQRLRTALTASPVLAYPNDNDKYIIDCDASNEGLGAVLSQVQDGTERVICFYSKAFSSAERKYCVTRRELLAMITSIKNFHHYLYGRKFLVRTDHGALRWLFNFKNPEGQIARWFETLAAYDFEIEHRPGRIHSNADALSRRPCFERNCSKCSSAEERYGEFSHVGNDLNPMENGVPKIGQTNDENANLTTDKEGDPIPSASVRMVGIGTTDSINMPSTSFPPDQSNGSEYILNDVDIPAKQGEDKILAQIIDWKQTNKKPQWEEIANKDVSIKYYWHRFESFVLRGGVLYRSWEKEVGDLTYLLVLPSCLKKLAFEHLHNSPTGGHLGVKKTLYKLRSRFSWYGMRSDVRYWVNCCDICSSRKRPAHKPKAPLKLYCVGAPMERIAMDIMGPLPLTLNGNKYVLVVGDYFTKYTDAYPIKDTTALTVADTLIERFVTHFGVPLSLHTDQGSNFGSKVFASMCQTLAIHKTRTTPFRPQSDGMIERANQTIKNMLSAFVNENQNDWDKYLPMIMMAYRSSIHESTGVTPNKMMYGREITLPVDLVFGTPEMMNTDNYSLDFNYAYELEQKINRIHNFARGRLNMAGANMKRNYDKKLAHNSYEVGTPVWVHNPKPRKGLSRKLQRDWQGPYIVTQIINSVIYRIQESPRAKPKIVHHDKLKRYEGNCPPTWHRV